jgi:hypothetical protein
MRNAKRGGVVYPDDLLAQIRARYADLVQTTTWGARALRYEPGGPLAHGVDFVRIEERDDDGDDGDGGDHPRDAHGLDALGAYRLAFGVTPERYAELFGRAPAWQDARNAPQALDTIVPHPTFAWMSWAAVVNPTTGTVERLWPLLDEGYALARRRHAARTDLRAAGVE